MVKFPQPLAFHKNYDEIRIRKREVSNMIQIRPVSDLRNKYPEVERLVTQQQQPVFLTKNGYGSMVVMSIKYCGDTPSGTPHSRPALLVSGCNSSSSSSSR